MTDTYVPDDQRDLTPLMTRRGREMLLAAGADSRTCRISHVAVGSTDVEHDGGGYTVTADQTHLHHERQRVACKVQVQPIDDTHTRAHVTAIVGRSHDGPDPMEPAGYEVREIGFFLTEDPADGSEPEPVLFAVWACEPGGAALMTKSPDVDLLLSFELVLPDVAPERVQISETHLFDFPDASEAIGGVIRLASADDVTAASSHEVAVTPATLPYATSLGTEAGDAKAFYVDREGTAHLGHTGPQTAPGLVISRTPQPHTTHDDGTTAYVPARTLHLQGGGPHQSGARLNFGDADYVYVDEPMDDVLRLHGSTVVVTAGVSCALDTELEKADGTKPSGLHLHTTGDMQLQGQAIRLKGPVHVEGALNVSQTISSPKFREMVSFTAGSADPGYTRTWQWTRHVPAPGDFLLLASFEDVETAPWHLGTIQLIWDDEVVSEVRTSTFFHDAGTSHTLVTSPSTHSLRVAQPAGTHQAKVSFWCESGWMKIAKCQLSLIEL